jgi:hypothetical protein
MAKVYGVVQCERLSGWNMEFRNIFGGICGIARVFEWNLVEYGWNERNGTTEYPEQTEERQMGRAGSGGTEPYRKSSVASLPLRLHLGDVEGMGNAWNGVGIAE